jgi:hypothetical protein
VDHQLFFNDLNYTHQINFDDGNSGLSPHKKSIWGNIYEFAKGFNKNGNIVSKYVEIQRCKKQIIDAIDALSGMKNMILNSHQHFQSYVYEKFVEYFESQGKLSRSDQERCDIYINLIKDKSFFDDVCIKLKTKKKGK